MPSVRLDRYEAENGEMPQVCMRCGEPATTVTARTFSWYPSWVMILFFCGLLPYILVAWLTTKRMLVRLPLCDQHENHWRWRSQVTWGGLALLVLLGVAAVVAG